MRTRKRRRTARWCRRVGAGGSTRWYAALAARSASRLLLLPLPSRTLRTWSKGTPPLRQTPPFDGCSHCPDWSMPATRTAILSRAFPAIDAVPVPLGCHPGRKRSLVVKSYPGAASGTPEVDVACRTAGREFRPDRSAAPYEPRIACLASTDSNTSPADPAIPLPGFEARVSGVRSAGSSCKSGGSRLGWNRC